MKPKTIVFGQLYIYKFLTSLYHIIITFLPKRGWMNESRANKYFIANAQILHDQIKNKLLIGNTFDDIVAVLIN